MRVNKLFILVFFIFFIYGCGKTDLEKLGMDNGNKNKEIIIYKEDNIEEDNIEEDNIEEDNIEEDNIEEDNIKEKLELTDLELLKQGYKLNNLGKINEYYKKDGNEYKTVYIEGTKKLFFSIIESEENNKIKIYYPKEEIIIKKIGKVYQPIFKKDSSEGRVIINDINTIKVINKRINFSEIIWLN